MNKDNIKGNLEKLGGKIKETVGEITGNEALKNEGKVDQVKGSVHDTVGDVKDHISNLSDRAKKLSE